jgi:hypothetical protein
MNIKTNRYTIKVFLAFICFGLFSCQDSNLNKVSSVADSKTETETSLFISEEEFKVYSYLLNNDKSLMGSRIFIANKTSSGLIKPYSNLKEVLSAVGAITHYTLPEELSDDYISKNEKTTEINDNFDLKLDYKVGDAGEFNNDNFGVIYGFSRVGFNKEKKIALVYFEYYGGAKNAGGTFVILTRNDGKWSILKKYTPWIS